MNSAQEVLDLAQSLGVRLWRAGDILEYEGATTPDLLKGLSEYKGPILAILDKNSPEPPPSPVADDEPDFHLTDAGNGEMFAHLHGAKVRYDHRRQRWLMWNGHWWSDDADGEVIRMAKETARERFIQSWDIEDEGMRRAAAKWAFSSESRGRIDATLALAQSEHPIADVGDKWDLDPWLLGVPNGVVQLAEGKLRKGKQADRITMHTSVPFDAKVKTPRWSAFLREVFVDEDLIDFIWRALGYSITGITNEQVVFICYGSGANGKGRFFAAIRNILGSYGYNTSFSTLEATKNQTHPQDVASLMDRRFVTASETRETSRFNEGRLKSLSGGDRQTAHFMHSNEFEFEPVLKLWLAVNHRPQVYDESYAFWRRVRMIPFLVTFDKDAEDKDLDLKLRPEYPGILAWLIQGCLEWQRRGLDPPDSVIAATEEYRQEANPLSEFVETSLVRTQPGMHTSSKRLFEAYNKWAEDEGITQRERVNRKTFGGIMGDAFGRAVQATSGPDKNRRVYRQVGLREEGDVAESRELPIQPALSPKLAPDTRSPAARKPEKALPSSTPPKKDENSAPKEERNARDPWD